MADYLSDAELERLGSRLLALLAMVLAEEFGGSVDEVRACVSEVISDAEAGLIGSRRLVEAVTPVTMAALQLMVARGERGVAAAEEAVRGPADASLRQRGSNAFVAALVDLSALFAERTG